MVRYSKSMRISPPRNTETLNDISYNLDVIQTPLHGRECGKGLDGGARKEASLSLYHRRYIKPSPIISLSLSTSYNMDKLYVTQYCLSYFFLKISLFNVNTKRFEDSKLNCSQIVVGQLVKLDKSHKDFSSFVFEYNDLSIKEKGEYKLVFQLYKVDGYQGNGLPFVKKLNSITTKAFHIFSGRKYYSDERKEERKVLFEASSSRHYKKKKVSPKDSRIKSRPLMSLLCEHFQNNILDSDVNILNNFGKRIKNAKPLEIPNLLSVDKDSHYKKCLKRKTTDSNVLDKPTKYAKLSVETFQSTLSSFLTNIVPNITINDQNVKPVSLRPSSSFSSSSCYSHVTIGPTGTDYSLDANFLQTLETLSSKAFTHISHTIDLSPFSTDSSLVSSPQEFALAGPDQLFTNESFDYEKPELKFNLQDSAALNSMFVPELNPNFENFYSDTWDHF